MAGFISRRNILLGASGAAISNSLFIRSGAAAVRPTRITIANASGGLNLIMAALMRQEKFLQSFDLDPDVLQVADGSKILGGVVGGSVDASMMAGFGQVFPAVERGASVKILGGGALLPTLALYTGKPNVKSLKDLEGRTVGTGSVGALVYQLTVTLLKKYKVDISKVKFVDIGASSDIFRAVSAGTVDAGAGEAALIEDAEKYHVRLIPHGNMSVELTEYTFQGAWASDQRIATKRDALVRTLAAYAKLYRFVQNPNSKEAFLRASRAAFSNASEHDHKLQWDYIQTYKPFAVDLTLSPKRLQYMQELNVSFKIQKKVLPFARVADMSLAADAVKLLG